MKLIRRKLEQKIKIGADVVITVTQISGRKVTLGVEAPKETPIVMVEGRPTPPDAAGRRETPPQSPSVGSR